MAKKGPAPARPGPGRQPTLGQATGGRPGRVPAAGATPAAAPATPRPPRAPGLGLGLGLNARQRGAFQQAAQQGQGAAYLGQNPALAARVNQLNPTGWRAQNVQNFIGSYGQRQPRGGPGAAAPGGAPPPPTPQPPPSFVGPRGTPGGDELTPYGISQLGVFGGNMADQMGGMYGGGAGGGMFGGGAGGGMFGAGGPFGGYSPAMQQVLQARMQGGGMPQQPWNTGGGAFGSPNWSGGTGWQQFPSGGWGMNAQTAGQQRAAMSQIPGLNQSMQNFGGGGGGAFTSNAGAAQTNQQQATPPPRAGYTPTGTGMGQGSPV